MSMDLKDALRHAQEAGEASFDLRDVDEVIAPATRRVRRHKAMSHGVSAVAAAAVVVGGLWGIGELEARPFATAEPGAELDAADRPIIATMQPDSGVRTYAAEEVPSILTLVDDATPRAKGEAATGRSAALQCARNGDPLATHDYSVPGVTYVFADCKPIWIDGDVQLTLSGATAVNFSQATQTVTIDYELVNTGSAPVAVYSDPYGTIQTDAISQDAESVHGDGVALSGTTMWNAADSVVALMTSNIEAQVINVGESMSGRIVWKGSDGEDSNEIDRVLAGATTFFFTINPRVVQSDPAAPVLILELGGSDFTYLTTDQSLTRQ